MDNPTGLDFIPGGAIKGKKKKIRKKAFSGE